MLHTVIMAGGGGARLWPLSTRELPKQFLRLQGGDSMIRRTVERLEGIVPPERTWVVTLAEQAEALEREELPVPPENVLLEPLGRNTAPAVGLAAQCIHAQDPEAKLLVLPADHLIRDRELFAETVERGLELVRERDGIVTLGIEPTRPETGYGYIELGEELGGGVHQVARFREKPDAPTARRFLEAGGFLWNSGIFLWSTSRILSEIERRLPELAASLTAIAALDEADAEGVAELYAAIEPVSLDYGILERTEEIYVVRAGFDWSDVGGYEELYRLGEKGEGGNVLLGEVFARGTQGSYLRNDTGIPMAVVGLEDVVAVATEEGILLCPRELAGSVREVRAWADERSRQMRGKKEE